MDNNNITVNEIASLIKENHIPVHEVLDALDIHGAIGWNINDIETRFDENWEYDTEGKNDRLAYMKEHIVPGDFDRMTDVTEEDRDKIDTIIAEQMDNYENEKNHEEERSL